MVQAVMEGQEIGKKKTEQLFKALGILRKRPGVHEGGKNKGISELRQREKVSGETARP